MDKCKALLKTGKNKGTQCRYKAKDDGYCKIHKPKTTAYPPEEKEECSVCYNEYDEIFKKETTSCNHVFCSKCLAKVSKCPMCRFELKPQPSNNVPGGHRVGAIRERNNWSEMLTLLTAILEHDRVIEEMTRGGIRAREIRRRRNIRR